jgi:hypothetical protein
MKKAKRVSLIIIVAALLAAPSQASAQGERAQGHVVSHDSFGPVKIGMTLPQASRALGVRVTRDAGYEGDDCYYATPKGAFKGVAFMMAGARVVRIDVESGNYTTDKGAKIGDSEARIKRLYKGGYKVSKHKYFDAGRYIEIEIKGGRYSIIFETDGRRVTTYRVGRPEQVGYVERCS